MLEADERFANPAERLGPFALFHGLSTHTGVISKC